MTVTYFQKGFNYGQDGRGNRLIYHLKGCNMCCPWCSNPEGMKAEKVGKFKFTEETAEQIVNEAVACSPMFFENGGVTLTGGEVAVQIESVKEILKGLKEKGIDTCIETNGSLKRLPELFEFLDSIIIDFKSADNEKLKSVTGGNLEIIRRNIKLATEVLSDVLIRVPLVGGFNNSEEDINLIKESLTSFKHKAKIEFLKYHEFGKEKWAKCGYKYQMTGEAFITEEDYKKITETFKKDGFKVVNT